MKNSIIVYRFSFIACVLSDALKGKLNRDIEWFFNGTKWQGAFENFDLSKLPKDYDGDNYDLVFDKDRNFIRAEKDLIGGV